MIMRTGEDTEDLSPQEAAMREAMVAYRGGDTDLACQQYYNAFVISITSISPDDSEASVQDRLTSVRAARGVAACLMSGATLESANASDIAIGLEGWLRAAQRAAQKASMISNDPDAHLACRERIVTDEALCRLKLSWAIDHDLGGQPPEKQAELIVDYWLAWADLIDYETEHLDGRPDQNRINMAHRRALAEGLYGSRVRGMSLAAGAIALGLVSESPRLPTSLGHLSRLERAKVVRRHVSAGVGAAAVAAISTRRPTRRRQAALRVARRIA